MTRTFDPQPTIGRIVHYRLTKDQADRVNAVRVAARGAAPGVQTSGAMMHQGAVVTEGDTFPMMVVRILKDERGRYAGVNGQLFLDGADSLWVKAVLKGSRPGTWSWPEKAA